MTLPWLSMTHIFHYRIYFSYKNVSGFIYFWLSYGIIKFKSWIFSNLLENCIIGPKFEKTKPFFKNFFTQHTQAVHATGQQQASQTGKLEKLPRPTFTLNMTESQWSFTKTQWDSYIKQSVVPESVKVMQLQAACDKDLRQRVFDTGNYASLTTEDAFLSKMKELAVIVIHKSIHLRNLWKTVQQPDEPVRAFVAIGNNLMFLFKGRKRSPGPSGTFSWHKRRTKPFSMRDTMWCMACNLASWADCMRKLSPPVKGLEFRPANFLALAKPFSKVMPMFFPKLYGSDIVMTSNCHQNFILKVLK